MSVKDDVLTLLAQSHDFLSGEQIGKQLFCSRNAVWKAINSLKSNGYEIEAVTNKGYRLSGDLFCAAGIKKYLVDADKFDIEVKNTVGSTNEILKQAAQNGANQWKIVAANEQTNGKGRRTRSFFSPKSGLYLSILLRPEISADDSLMITTAAAVAVSDAISSVCNKECGIKWVNDLFLNGKKICGILTEGSIDFETGGLQYAVLGIGVNVENPKNEFPPELKDIAGAIYEKAPLNLDVKNRLCAEIINRFCGYYENLEKREFMKEYKNRSTVIGKKINILQNDSSVPALAVDINDNAGLIVKLDSGEEKTLTSGEVSIRLQ